MTSDRHEPQYLDFYDVVEVLDSAATRALGIVGKAGLVLGLPPHLIPGIDDPDPPADDPGDEAYAVDVDDDGYSVLRRDLRATGRRMRREDFYDGSSIRVSVTGELREVDLRQSDEPD